MNTQEILIPVPWGHISAKMYGNHCNSAVLCVHGIQDNCDTFSTLLPLLPKEYYYVCIDLPGHGHSSHFPQFVPLEFTNYLSAIKLVKDHFCWSQFVYLGHSFGGQLGTWFTALYPECIKCLIILDTMGPRDVERKNTMETVKSRIDDFHILQRRQSGRDPPVYTYDQAVDKIRSGRPSKLTDESAHILAKRSLIRVDENRFKFAYDQRLKLPFHPVMTFDQHENIINRISCPTIFVLADENCGRYSTYLKNAYEFYSTRPNMTIRTVNGNHDVHLNHPDRVFAFVSEFLKQNY
ncbi:serine hydrolase-like protein isoform X3 [Adelges cooleyi]|uniref:serine hydrolase-like protein isoform X3 n=1 Tax=Adelges cooleyi TaxID=133065 RepID=UPI00217F46BE|nr:serine hydrolase-like protein isoform X3 [Adelges cooleyi]